MNAQEQEKVEKQKADEIPEQTPVQPQPPAVQYLQYQPPYYPPPKQPFDFTQFARIRFIIVGIGLGLIIMFIGAVICNGSAISEEPDDRTDAYYDAVGFYKIGAIVYNLGVLIISIALFWGAIVNNKLNPYVRLGMLIVAGLILGWAGFNLWSNVMNSPYYGYYFPYAVLNHFCLLTQRL